MQPSRHTVRYNATKTCPCQDNTEVWTAVEFEDINTQSALLEHLSAENHFLVVDNADDLPCVSPHIDMACI